MYLSLPDSSTLLTPDISLSLRTWKLSAQRVSSGFSSWWQSWEVSRACLCLLILKKVAHIRLLGNSTIMTRLQTKAQKAYRDANNDVINVPNDIFKPSQPDEAKDDLFMFSGKAHTVSIKVGSGAKLPSSAAGMSNSILRS